jgi:two-component system cell cycle response regulator DivK
MAENRGTILYVEDNFDNRLLIRRVLNAEGYAVHEAASASAALETLQTMHPDLI